MFGLSAKFAVSGLAGCVAFCAAATASAGEAHQPLVQVWVASKPLKTVAACIIEALDIDARTYSKLSPSIRHVAKVRAPDKIVEIRPVDDDSVANSNHYVRLEMIADTITRVAFYSSDDSKQMTVKALAPCASD